MYVNARTDGWVERLDADFLGKPVAAVKVLLTSYSPDLVNGQEEYLAAHRLGDGTLQAAARRRLTLWNVAEEEIAELDRSGAARRAVEIRAPRGGEIAEKLVTAGQAVRAGDNLFLIADRSALWVEAAVFEMDAPVVTVGTPVTVTVGALPGRRYPGRVVFLQPELGRGHPDADRADRRRARHQLRLHGQRRAVPAGAARPLCAGDDGPQRHDRGGLAPCRRVDRHRLHQRPA